MILSTADLFANSYYNSNFPKHTNPLEVCITVGVHLHKNHVLAQGVRCSYLVVWQASESQPPTLPLAQRMILRRGCPTGDHIRQVLLYTGGCYIQMAPIYVQVVAIYRWHLHTSGCYTSSTGGCCRYTYNIQTSRNCTSFLLPYTRKKILNVVLAVWEQAGSPAPL